MKAKTPPPTTTVEFDYHGKSWSITPHQFPNTVFLQSHDDTRPYVIHIPTFFRILGIEIHPKTNPPLTTISLAFEHFSQLDPTPLKRLISTCPSLN